MSVTLYNTPDNAQCSQDMSEVNNLIRKAMSDNYRYMVIVTGNRARLPGLKEMVILLIRSRSKTDKLFFFCAHVYNVLNYLILCFLLLSFCHSMRFMFKTILLEQMSNSWSIFISSCSPSVHFYLSKSLYCHSPTTTST